MAGIGKELMDTYKNGGILIKLIFINSIIFIIQGIIGLFWADLFKNWLSMPSDWQELIYKPWTLVTYNFYHEGVLHFFFNILNLFWFGKIFLIYFNDKKLLSLYLLGGIIGGMLFAVVYNAFPAKFPANHLLGASASIMAIIIAAAVYAPNFKVYMVFLGEVKLIYIGLFSFILSLILINSENAGGNIAHIGGAIFGYLWVKQYQRGVEITGWFAGILDFFGSLFKRRKMKVVHKQPPRDELEYNHQKNVNQKEIDRILDKISKAGYDSLTKSEKETLFHLSNKKS